jgi:hypothetical protein
MGSERMPLPNRRMAREILHKGPIEHTDAVLNADLGTTPGTGAHLRV